MAKEKGLVLEAGDGWAIVLLPGGDYKRIRTRECLEVGQLYRLKSNAALKYASVAAVFLIITIASLDFFTVTARANVSPGINLGLNRWDRVVSVATSNDAGKEEIKDLSLNGKSLDQAINLIVEGRGSESGFRAGDMAGENTEICVSLSVKNDNDEQRKEKLLSIIDASLKHSMAEHKSKSSAVKVVREGDKLTVVDPPGKSSNAPGSNINKGERNKPEPKPQEHKINHPSLKKPTVKEEHKGKTDPRDNKLMGNQLNNDLPTSAASQSKKIDSPNGTKNNSSKVEQKEKNQPEKGKGQKN